MPPISNLWKYTGMGFDLVAFSGGKGMRGPQNAGLLLGRKVLTDLAHANNNPGDGIGRGMKVAKEQIVGMVAAVDWVLSHTEESMQGDYQKRVDLIASAVKGIPSVRTETVIPRIANHVPHLLIRFDPAVTGVTTRQIVDALRKGTPSIELNPNTGQQPNQGIPADANTLVVGVWMLQPGEDAVVGRRIRAALTKREVQLAESRIRLAQILVEQSKPAEAEPLALRLRGSKIGGCARFARISGHTEYFGLHAGAKTGAGVADLQGLLGSDVRERGQRY
jgi:L-seryl-tRNA(Ser) seleniumtransferase